MYSELGHHTIDIRINGHSLAICPIICECVRSPALNSENVKKATKRDFETSDYGAGTSMLELRSFSDKVLVEHVVSFEIEAHRGDLLDREQFLASVTGKNNSMKFINQLQFHLDHYESYFGL